MAERKPGPDAEDVFVMLDMVARDLNLSLRLGMLPRPAAAPSYFLMSLIVEPRTPAPNLWEPWSPLVYEWEWWPKTGKTWAATVWTAVFMLYSLDLPSEWPTRPVVAQQPLPEG